MPQVTFVKAGNYWKLFVDGIPKNGFCIQSAKPDGYITSIDGQFAELWDAKYSLICRYFWEMEKLQEYVDLHRRK